MDLNPIVRFELIRTARWHPHYAMRAALSLISLYVMWVLYDWASHDVLAGSSQRSAMFRDLPQLAKVIFLEMTLLQGLAAVLLMPGLVAGSIALEDRRGTMLHLLATPLSTAAIVLGKLAVSFVQVGVVVSAGLAFVIPLWLLGVLDPEIVVYADAMLLALAFFTGSLSLLVSVLVPRPRLAIPMAYMAVAAWLLLPAWLEPMVARLGGPFVWLRVLKDWLLRGHPNEAVWFLWRFPTAGLADLANYAWARTTFSRAFPRVVEMHAASSLLCLLLSTLFFRPLRLGLWKRKGREPAFPSRPALGDDPMLWKERYAPIRSSRTAVRLVTIMADRVPCRRDAVSRMAVAGFPDGVPLLVGRSALGDKGRTAVGLLERANTDWPGLDTIVRSQSRAARHRHRRPNAHGGVVVRLTA